MNLCPAYLNSPIHMFLTFILMFLSHFYYSRDYNPPGNCCAFRFFLQLIKRFNGGYSEEQGGDENRRFCWKWLPIVTGFLLQIALCLMIVLPFYLRSQPVDGTPWLQLDWLAQSNLALIIGFWRCSVTSSRQNFKPVLQSLTKRTEVIHHG